MKNSAFSLIEITVAIALIGIMAGIGVPKFRTQLAIGRDTKAIATLATLRTASELYFIDKGEPIYDGTLEDGSNTTSLENLEEYLDSKTFEDIKDGKISIGGSRAQNETGEAEDDVIYGGEIGFTFINPNTSKKGDGVYLWFKPDTGKEFDTKGNKWIDY